MVGTVSYGPARQHAPDRLARALPENRRQQSKAIRASTKAFLEVLV